MNFKGGLVVVRDLVWTVLGILLIVATIYSWSHISYMSGFMKNLSSSSSSYMGQMMQGAGGIGLQDFDEPHQSCITSALSAERVSALQEGAELSKADIDTAFSCFDSPTDDSI